MEGGSSIFITKDRIFSLTLRNLAPKILLNMSAEQKIYTFHLFYIFTMNDLFCFLHQPIQQNQLILNILNHLYIMMSTKSLVVWEWGNMTMANMSDRRKDTIWLVFFICSLSLNVDPYIHPIICKFICTCAKWCNWILSNQSREKIKDNHFIIP